MIVEHEEKKVGQDDDEKKRFESQKGRRPQSGVEQDTDCYAQQNECQHERSKQIQYKFYSDDPESDIEEKIDQEPCQEGGHLGHCKVTLGEKTYFCLYGSVQGRFSLTFLGPGLAHDQLFWLKFGR